jgi:hypothetical protein
MPIHVVAPPFVKQAAALVLLVLIPVTSQFGYFSSEYQLHNFIRSYPESICNVFTQREIQKYFLFRYDQLVKKCLDTNFKPLIMTMG